MLLPFAIVVQIVADDQGGTRLPRQDLEAGGVGFHFVIPKTTLPIGDLKPVLRIHFHVDG